MAVFLAFLTPFLPFTTLANSDVSSSAIDCSVSPTLCPDDTFIPLADSPAHASKPDPISFDPTDRFKPYPPTVHVGLSPQTASGDVLNTTRCFCASPYWRDDHTYGYYQLFTSYNYHHDSIFTFDIACKSPKYRVASKHGGHDDLLVPECLRERHGEKWCTSVDNRGEVGNTFCYEFNGNDKSDVYRFNRQKRNVPLGATFRESMERTLDVCGGFCGNLVGGLDVLDGEALTAVANDAKGVGKSDASAILSFGNTDDMCEECK